MLISNLEKYSEEYLIELVGVKRASLKTIEAYKIDILQFIKFIEKNSVTMYSQINERFIRRYLFYLNEQKMETASVRRKLSALRRFFNFLLKREIVENNSFVNISSPKKARKLPKTLSEEMFYEIINQIEKENPDNKSEVMLMFELLYGDALRVSELCNLNISDLDFANNHIRIFGKGSKTRFVPISRKIREKLITQIKERNSNKNSPLFLTKKGLRVTPRQIQYLVKHYTKDSASSEKQTPHTFRHSAATHMLDNGADLLAVKELLGHENLSTTQIYTHVSVEHLKKVYKQSHPKS